MPQVKDHCDGTRNVTLLEGRCSDPSAIVGDNPHGDYSQAHECDWIQKYTGCSHETTLVTPQTITPYTMPRTYELDS